MFSFMRNILSIRKFAFVYYSSRCIHYSWITFDIKKYFSSEILPFRWIFRLFINFDVCNDLVIPEEAGKLWGLYLLRSWRR